LEISEANVKKKIPKELLFTSKRDKYQRFQTKEIKELVDQLEDVEQRKEAAITPFICKIFLNFHNHHLTWSQLIRCMCELDCLCSLAVVSSAVTYLFD
jgi:DNA mismatch repair ATPase MutS